MKANIEVFLKKKSKKIANVILKKYGLPILNNKSFWQGFLDGLLDDGYSRIIIRQEIYQISLYEVYVFLLNQNKTRLTDEVIDYLKRSLINRSIEEEYTKIEKLKTEELLAQVIQMYTIDFLSERDFHV